MNSNYINYLSAWEDRIYRILLYLVNNFLKDAIAYTQHETWKGPEKKRA